MFKFAIVVVILAVISLGALIYPNFSHKMPYREPTRVIVLQYQEIDYEMSNCEIRQRVEDLTGIRFYWYSDKVIDNGVGKSNLYLRHVVMDETSSQNDYIEILCHELLHFKYFTHTERFVTYKTFVTLYESEFRQVAINMAWEMQNGRCEKEYNCLAQICDYLAQ